MTVVFDAEALLAFSFDEPGAREVEQWLDRVYDGELNGYVTTVNLAEFRYIAIRNASVEEADTQIANLRDMGLTEYDVDDLWELASELKAEFSPAIGDAYAVAATKELDDTEGQRVTLLVGADTDYDAFEGDEDFSHLIERFRDKPF